jgi:hypothetical protein
MTSSSPSVPCVPSSIPPTLSNQSDHRRSHITGIQGRHTRHWRQDQACRRSLASAQHLRTRHTRCYREAHSRYPPSTSFWRNRTTNTLQRSTSRALVQAVHASVVLFSAVLSSPTLPHRQYHLSYNLWHNYNLPFLAATPPLNPSSRPPTPNTQS